MSDSSQIASLLQYQSTGTFHGVARNVRAPLEPRRAVGWASGTERSKPLRFGVVSMEVGSLLVAALGVVLGTASLTWQAATYALSGGRAKVELRVGAMHAAGSGMVTANPRNLSEGWATLHAEQGYTHPVIGVRVRNPGRMPVTIERWSIVCFAPTSSRRSLLGKVEDELRPRELMELQALGESIGPPLPHRLDAGTSEMWAMDAQNIAAFASGQKEAFKLRAVAIAGRIELGDGRTRTTDRMMI